MDNSTQLALAQELARCYADPLRFVLWAFPWGELPETCLVELPEPWRSRYPQCKYGPDIWACRFLEDVGAEVRARGFDGRNPVDPIKMAVASGRGIGKSALTAWLVCWIMATRPLAKGVVTANTANQLTTKTWGEIVKWMKRSVVRDMFTFFADSIQSKESPEVWRVDAITCREENSESFAGQHAATSTQFYIFDEASGIPEKIFDVAEGSLTDGEPMIFLFGNPTRNSGRFFECFHRRKKFWNTRSIDSRDVTITNKRQLQNWAEEYGEDSDFFKVNVKGTFPSQGYDQFIPGELVEAAMLRQPPVINRANCAVIGVDVARFGDDNTVIVGRIGRDGTLPIRRYNGLKVTEVAREVKRYMRFVRETYRVPRIYIFVDSGGVGGGVVDILSDDGFPVTGVDFSSTPDDKDTYPYKREEMWGRFGKWLEEGVLPEDSDLKEDIISPTYKIDIHGRRKLESKDDMKKRGLRSPDAADAFALTFSQLIHEYSEGGPGGRGERMRQRRLAFNPYDRRQFDYATESGFF